MSSSAPRLIFLVCGVICFAAAVGMTFPHAEPGSLGHALSQSPAAPPAATHSSPVAAPALDYISMLFVFMLASFIGLGVIRRVSRLLHTPLMSLTNAISAIAVVGSIIVAGGEGYPPHVRAMGAVALFASMTNIISGFLITDRTLKMFKPSAAREAAKA